MPKKLSGIVSWRVYLSRSGQDEGTKRKWWPPETSYSERSLPSLCLKGQQKSGPYPLCVQWRGHLTGTVGQETTRGIVPWSLSSCPLAPCCWPNPPGNQRPWEPDLFWGTEQGRWSGGHVDCGSEGTEGEFPAHSVFLFWHRTKLVSFVLLKWILWKARKNKSCQ